MSLTTTRSHESLASVLTEEQYRMVPAWLNRDRDPADSWPGEPAEPPVPHVEICLGCGREHPASDVYEIAPDVWRCLECWVVSR